MTVAGEAPEPPADLLDKANGISFQNVGVTEVLKPKAMTELAKDRLARLVQKVKEVQFLLRMELPKFLQVRLTAASLLLTSISRYNLFYRPP